MPKAPKLPKPERDCAICGVAEEQPYEPAVKLTTCVSCGKLHCDQCGTKKHCSGCAAYNLPKQFKVLSEGGYRPPQPNGCHRYGGSILEIDTPVYRWYDDHPREVKISAMKYHGIGIHWHITIAEKDDVYQAKAGGWIEPWSDRSLKGRYESKPFTDEARVAAWVRKTLTAWYRKDKLVYVTFDQHEHPARWFYKEGD